MRARIALAVWFVSLLLTVPAAIMAVLGMLSLFDGGGNSGHATSTPFIIVFVAAAAVGGAVTAMLEEWVQRESGNRVHAGPSVVGCAIGLVAGALVSQGGASLFVTAGVLPFAGAAAGTLVKLPLPWPATAMIAGLVVTLAVSLNP